MKKLLFLLAILPLYSMVANANNVIVLDGVTAGTFASGCYEFPTINSATTASTTNIGDTIIIKNTTLGSGVRTEAVSVTKSLVFVPYYDNDVINVGTVDTGGFLCSGVWTISGSPGMTVTIIGMNNTNGQIITSASSTAPTAANRCSVRLLGCNIINTTNATATIYFNTNYFDLLLSGSKISTSAGSAYGVYYQHGSIIGDSIYQASGTYNAIYCAADGAVSNDTSFIIGNMVVQYYRRLCTHRMVQSANSV